MSPNILIAKVRKPITRAVVLAPVHATARQATWMPMNGRLRTTSMVSEPLRVKVVAVGVFDKTSPVLLRLKTTTLDAIRFGRRGASQTTRGRQLSSPLTRSFWILIHPWNDDRCAPFAVAPLSRLVQWVTVRARSPASLYETRGEKILEVFEQRTAPLGRAHRRWNASASQSILLQSAPCEEWSDVWASTPKIEE